MVEEQERKVRYCRILDMVKPARITFLILLSAMFLILVGLSTPRANSVSVVSWSGIIRIQSIDYSGGVAKTVFVLDDWTGSSDIHERSTTWILESAPNDTYGIPIGLADPDWQLVGTNNITLWHWKLEKSFDLQCSSFYSNLKFPFEDFTIHFYVASNITRWFSVASEIPNFSATITLQVVRYNQTSLLFKPEGCPSLQEVTIHVFHDLNYEFIVSILYALLAIIFLMGCLLPFRRAALGLSNYLVLSSSILIFLPIFFLTFRGSLAPTYLTVPDGLCLLSMFVYGLSLFIEVWLKKNPDSDNASSEERPAQSGTDKSVESEKKQSQAEPSGRNAGRSLRRLLQALFIVPVISFIATDVSAGKQILRLVSTSECSMPC
jgi:hypothetical protein